MKGSLPFSLTCICSYNANNSPLKNGSVDLPLVETKLSHLITLPTLTQHTKEFDLAQGQ